MRKVKNKTILEQTELSYLLRNRLANFLADVLSSYNEDENAAQLEIDALVDDITGGLGIKHSITEIVGMPTRIKVTKDLEKHFLDYWGRVVYQGDDIYKPLIMVTLIDDNSYSFTYNMSNFTLAYTVNYSEIRYTKAKLYELKHKLEVILDANYD